MEPAFFFKTASDMPMMDERFKKVWTESPEENRALRAVGNTWEGPAQ